MQAPPPYSAMPVRPDNRDHRQLKPATVHTLSFERIPLVPSRRAGIPQFAVTVLRCSSVVGAMGFPISPSPTHGAHHGVQ